MKKTMAATEGFEIGNQIICEYISKMSKATCQTLFDKCKEFEEHPKHDIMMNILICTFVTFIFPFAEKKEQALKCLDFFCMAAKANIDRVYDGDKR